MMLDDQMALELLSALAGEGTFQGKTAQEMQEIGGYSPSFPQNATAQTASVDQPYFTFSPTNPPPWAEGSGLGAEQSLPASLVGATPLVSQGDSGQNAQSFTKNYHFNTAQNQVVSGEKQVISRDSTSVSEISAEFHRHARRYAP